MTDFVCAVDERYRSACKDLPKYPGTRYCVLHYPGEEKNKEDLLKVKESKLERKDYDFGGTVFPEGTSDFEDFEFTTSRYYSGANFSGATFSGNANFAGANFSKRADFSGTITFSDVADFTKANFSEEETNFYGATFSELAEYSQDTFGGATFSKRANFHRATFSEGVDFSNVTFSGRADFSGASFSEGVFFWQASFGKEVRFFETTFRGEASFAEVTFSELANFAGATLDCLVNFAAATFRENAIFLNVKTFPQTAFKFTNTTIEKPERISFHTTHLRPSWFVDVDAQEFDFSDVEWFRLPNGDRLDLDNEIEALKRRGIGPPWSLRKLTKACRMLMNNAEENRDYPTANEFHYWSMEAQRKEGWGRLGLIASLYWALSGYGERPYRAFWVLVGMCATFAALYMLLGPTELQNIGQAVVYSLGAAARLNPEPKPNEPGLFQFLVIAEGLLGPLQIGLLLLAIRRKVMR